jgi:hypothetical protein
LGNHRRLYDYDADSGWKVPGDLEEIVLLSTRDLPLLTARLPAIDRQFSSPLHTSISILRGRGPWEPQFLAFIGGRTPAVRMRESRWFDSERTQLRDCAVYAIESGCPGTLTVDADQIVNVELALDDRIADTIDLDALKADYTNWFARGGINAGLGGVACEIMRALGDTIAELRRTRYADPALGDATQHGLLSFMSNRIRTGILFGDDPAMTCASILERFTGDRRLWEFALLPPTDGLSAHDDLR